MTYHVCFTCIDASALTPKVYVPLLVVWREAFKEDVVSVHTPEPVG